MTNGEYQIVLHALDAARMRFGLDLLSPDEATERIRLLINMTVKASESAIFAAAVSLTNRTVGVRAALTPSTGSPQPQLPLTVSIDEAAALLGLSAATIRRLVYRRKLKVLPFIRHQRVIRSSIHDFLSKE